MNKYEKNATLHTKNKENTFEKKYGINLEITKRFLDIDNEETLLKKLAESITQKTKRLGVGKNAEVFAIDYNHDELSELCVKKVSENPEIKINSIFEEAEFQAKAHDAGVRTPRYVMAIKDTDSRQEYILMERIKGVSLGDARDPYCELVMPDAYEHKVFFNNLKVMLDKMHDARIHHRDLHAGNVMVTEEGDPVIIDFGAACMSHYSDNDHPDIYRVQGQVLVNKEKGLYQFTENVHQTDRKKLELLEIEMREYFG